MEKKKIAVVKNKPRVRKGLANTDREASPQPSTEVSEKAKVVVLENYWNYDTMRQTPISNATMERLVEQGKIWARTDPDGIKLNQFLDIHGIPRNTWEKWRKKYEIIQRGHEVILTILGNKREHGMMTRKFDSASTMRMMTHYDMDWKENEEWRASLTNKSEQAGGVVVFKEVPVAIPVIKTKDGIRKRGKVE